MYLTTLQHHATASRHMIDSSPTTIFSVSLSLSASLRCHINAQNV